MSIPSKFDGFCALSFSFLGFSQKEYCKNSLSKNPGNLPVFFITVLSWSSHTLRKTNAKDEKTFPDFEQ